MLIPMGFVRLALPHLLHASYRGSDRSAQQSCSLGLLFTWCKCASSVMARNPAMLMLLCGRVANRRMVQLQLQDKCGGSSLHFACGHLRLPGAGLVCTCTLTKANNLLGVGPTDIIRSISNHPLFDALMADRQAESALQHCAAHESSVSWEPNHALPAMRVNVRSESTATGMFSLVHVVESNEITPRT